MSRATAPRRIADRLTVRETPNLIPPALADRLIAEALHAGRDHLSDVISWHAHVPFARALISLLQPQLVVELGVHKGDSLLSMAAAMRDLGQTGRLIGIDTWGGDAHAGHYDGDRLLPDLMQRAAAFGPALTLLRSRFEEALPGFAAGSIDLLHIDGLHTYEAVRGDFDSWRPKLSPRGVVMFHDTAVTGDGFGVWQLWDEVRGLGPSCTFAFGSGLGVLAPGPDVAPEVAQLLTSLTAGHDSAGRDIAGIFAAIGLAMEAESLRSHIALQAQARAVEQQDDRSRAGAEIARLNEVITTERAAAASEFSRLAREAERREAGGRISAQHELTLARMQLEEARRLAASEQARLEQLVRSERDLAAAEFARLEADATRREVAEHSRGAAEIARLEQLVREERAVVARDFMRRDEATADTARLQVKLEAGFAQQMADQAALHGSQLDALTSEKAAAQAALQALAEDHQALAGAHDALREGLTELQEMLTEETRLRALDRSDFHTEETRLNQMIDEDRATGGTEIARLNREIAGLHRDYQAALHNARLKSRLVRRFKRLAFPVFRGLPLPKQTKNRLRLAIINRWGQQLQLVPPKSPALTTQTQLLLRQSSTRILTLARAATGVPVNLPPRSVSIIIPVFNQIEYTLRCLDSIRVNSGDIEYEVIVVDDGSSDMTEIMLSARDGITYLRNPENLGFIGACNAGLAAATKTWVCYLNNDTEVTPGWLAALIDTFELHPGCGMAGAQLIYPDGRLQEAGGIIWDDFSGWNYGRLQDPEAPKYHYARQADYCSGAAILLPRTLALALGGFDPEFAPAYGEDSDLAFRLRAMGLSVIYQPLSRVVHCEGVTSGTDTGSGAKAWQVINAEKLKARWAHVLPHQGENGVDPSRAADRGRIGRVLVIDQITPEPDRDAGSITALELMLGLRDLGYKISFIPCSNFTYMPDYSDLLAAYGIESVLYPQARSVEDHLSQTGDCYDAVVLFRVNTASDHLEAVRRLAPSAKVIFHNSDLHFLREERAKLVDNPNVAELRPGCGTTKRVELSIIRAADVNIVHSHYEKELLAELLPEAKVVVFPWVYEPRGPGKPFAKRHNIVFLGGYRHYPNVDAVLHYAKDVAPLLGPAMAGVSFRAIGSNPTDEMKALASDHVKIDGFVEDLDPVLGAARVMLVPLRYGAGLKGKIVTALAHGLPVVTTTIGAEGMALTDGEEVLIADTPAEMAAAVERLYTDAALWQRLSLNGLHYVSRTTSRAAGYQIVSQILDHAGLAQLSLLPPATPAKAGAPGHHMQAGTPAALRDPLALARAALSAVRLEGEPEECLFWLPPGAALEASGERSPRIIHLSPHEGHAPEVFAGVNCLLLDAFDDASCETALWQAKAQGALRQGSVILFLPPVLDLRNHAWHLRHSLSDQPVAEGNARTPAHLRYADLLQTPGLRPERHADTSLTGFPGLTIAVLL